MEIEPIEDVDEKIIEDIVKPHLETLKSLQEFVSRVDDELNNITNKARIEVEFLLHSSQDNLYQYEYYALIFPDSISIYEESYCHKTMDYNNRTKSKIATVYL